MIDPITATAMAGAGAGILQTAAATANQSALGLQSTIAAAGTGASFQATMQNVAQTAMQKLLDAHPELQTQLGDGPYTMACNAAGALMLTSQTTGTSLTLDQTTALGRQATAIAKATGLKNFQNGLEFQTL
jgi:hypothetical protein